MSNEDSYDVEVVTPSTQQGCICIDDLDAEEKNFLERWCNSYADLYHSKGSIEDILEAITKTGLVGDKETKAFKLFLEEMGEQAHIQHLKSAGILDGVSVEPFKWKVKRSAGNLYEFTATCSSSDDLHVLVLIIHFFLWAFRPNQMFEYRWVRWCMQDVFRFEADVGSLLDAGSVLITSEKVIQHTLGQWLDERMDEVISDREGSKRVASDHNQSRV